MAKGGNNQRSNGSRFTKSYNSSNSFVTKVASKVSDYLGGWFGTSLKPSSDVETAETVTEKAPGHTAEKLVFESVEPRRSTFMPHRVFDDVDLLSSPSKRFKVSDKEKVDINFPISPIPSTSGLFQTTANHTFCVPKSEEFGASVPGPSDPRGKFGHTNDVVPQTSSTTIDVKANGATDNHSDSSESTSGCSSLVPQSDRLSQSAYACSTRKRNLESKLKYARQLQQSRASLYLNRSIPVSDAPRALKKPSFDVTAYGSPALDKSLLREKLINSPFYTGQTSYGGASAYRLSRNTFYSQRNPRVLTERREGMQVQVKPSHHGSTEDLSNMSHTAKKILEALEQFSTPVNDAKRIPVSRSNALLGMKRRRFEDMSETRLRLSTPISPLNPNPGPVITGLNVPTVPDLLKLKRLERIQNSTAAARQVAVQKQEYSLPSENPPEKRTGKIVTKLKNKEKDVSLEKLEEVNLPKIPLPITTLPKFDFQLPSVTQPAEDKTEKPKIRNFVFSPPITVFMKELPEQSVQKNNFTFSNPLNTDTNKSEQEKTNPAPLINFMSNDSVAKLKRKSINDKNVKSPVSPVPSELKTGSVMDFFAKNADEKVATVKPSGETWECSNCLIRNINDSKICHGCKSKKVTEESTRTLPSPPKINSPVADTKSPPSFGFGDKFKPPVGSWSCKECFVVNNVSASRCIACESNKPSAEPAKEAKEVAKPEPPKTTQNGFGDIFKKQANQWECSVCMIRNKDTDTKCAACEAPKPGTKPQAAEPKFNVGSTPLGGGFKFGIDKAGTEETGVKSAADSSTFQSQANGLQPESSAKPPQFNSISTSVGVFTFGIPPAQNKKEETKTETVKPTTETNSTFLVTSTSGFSVQKDESLTEKKSETDKSIETKMDKVTDSSKPETVKPFIFGALNKSPVKPFFGPAPEEKPAESKPPTFSFGTTSNANTLEKVSSSTTDFTFGCQNKTKTNQLTAGDTGSSKLPTTFQFKPFSPPETAKPKQDLNTPAEESKIESAAFTSGSVTTTPQSFIPSSIFNPSKMTFGATPLTTTTVGLGFGNGSIQPTSDAPLFGSSTPSFASSDFSSPTPAAPCTNSFEAMSRSPDNPTLGTEIAFLNSSVSFAGAPNPFGAAVSTAQSSEPPKTFGSFGADSSIPSFGSNPAPSPAFGTGFIQSSNTSKKFTNPAPFIFGGSASSSTSSSVSAPVVTASGVFTFGAAKPTFSFGQSTGPAFSFGSTTPATNVFEGFGHSKSENSLGTARSAFESTAPNIFGQGSVPAALETSSPKFEFGNPATQRQETAPSFFQFGSTSTQPQPASAPAGAGFSLSVPQKFNFTGGQTTVFSASPGAESSAVRDRSRKLIKAVRRTNRDPTRRPQ